MYAYEKLVSEKPSPTPREMYVDPAYRLINAAGLLLKDNKTNEENEKMIRDALYGVSLFAGSKALPVTAMRRTWDSTKALGEGDIGQAIWSQLGRRPERNRRRGRVRRRR
jgi:hypothetical protein